MPKLTYVLGRIHKHDASAGFPRAPVTANEKGWIDGGQDGDVKYWRVERLSNVNQRCTIHVDEWLPLPLTGCAVDGLDSSAI